MKFKMLLAGGAMALTIAGAASDKVAAATFTYDFSYNLATQTCGVAGRILTCYEYQLLPADTYGYSGDQYNIDVTVANNHVLKLPGSKTENLIFVELYDNQYQTSGSQPDTANATILPINYETLGSPTAPPFPIGYPGVIPLENTSNHIYPAYSGFCCGTGGYGLPNGGFSVTGADAVLNLQNSDPNPLSFILVGTQVAVPEPATWAMMLTGLFGLGALLRISRRRRDRAAVAA